MRIGDVQSGATKLEQAFKALSLRWEQAKHEWRDPTSRAFEENHLANLEPQVKQIVDAAARLAEVLDKAQHEVS